MKNIHFIFLISIALLNCSQPKNLSNNSSEFTLTPNGEISLELDSISNAEANNLYVHAIHDKEYLIKGNFSNWRLDMYDLSTGKLFKKLKFEKEGPNGVRAKPSGYYFHNLDSIFLFFNLSQRICLINSDGILLSEIRELNARKAPIADISYNRYPFLKKNRLYLPTYSHAYDNNNYSGMIINLQSRTQTYPYDLPEKYSHGYWGGVLYDVYYHDYNPKEHLIIQSYGADHKIYTIDEKGQRKSYLAKGNRLDQKIRPFSLHQQDYASASQQIYKFEALQGGYGQVKYDPYQEVYYRFVFNPVNPSEFHSPSQIWANPSIIILDKNFMKIGEFKLPKRYKFYFMFISEAGLNILDNKLYEQNEDRLTFTTFKIKEI